MTETAVDFLLENLEQLLNCDNPLILDEKDQIESLFLELGILKTFLKDSEEKCYQHEKVEKVENLGAQIRDVAYEAEDIIDSFVVSAVIQKDGSMTKKTDRAHAPDCSLNLVDVMEEIKSIKTEVMEIYEKKMYGIEVLQVEKSFGRYSSRVNTLVVEEDTVVGFDDEVMEIVERLTGEQKQLDIISIVGMAGLGKTTLARKVYNDPLITYHFYIRAWTYVSQAYQKRDLLLQILNSFVLLTDQIHKMTDEKLCEELYRRLKGKRYLVVIDDIWNNGAWDVLKRSFPNDNNGSRIMLTSRLSDVATHVKPGRPPHFLRFLTEEESWDLLQQKVFKKESCPSGLVEFGKQIAKKCQGLPLAVVVIAGLLANKDKTQEWWKQVAESLSSYIVSDPKQYMDTLALSYIHLPHHLKACFLYLGAFPEDYEIPVRKLIWLWVAEGFIRKKGQKSLEEVAEDCLMDLIDRSLVIAAQKRSNGGIKACRIHDLLRDLCLRKAEEEKFLQQICGCEQVSSSSSSSSIPFTSKQRRLCIHSHVFDYIFSKPSALHVRSLLCFAFEWCPLPQKSTSFIYQAFKLLRVLDLKSIGISSFPSEIERLVHLRHLALRAVIKNLPPSISNLWNLETLIVEGLSGAIILPYNIGKMAKLRNLYIKGETYIRHEREPNNYGHSFVLFNLQTISTLGLYHGNEEVLSRIPNIRKLGCIFVESWDGVLPKLDSLIHLETLKISYRRETKWPVKFPSTYKFPSNLKKLTLSRFRLPWTGMSIIGSLPNLEVLKLLDEAFKGPRWDANDGEFLQLKFLKFQELDIGQWNASSNHFPNLRRLVLAGCKKLEEIPYGVGDICTLEMIEVNCSSHSAANSAKQILEEQQSMGNDGVKILIYPRIEEEGAEEDATQE